MPFPSGETITRSLPITKGSCWRLKGNGSSWPAKSASQIGARNPPASGVPATSQQPMGPAELKNQTSLPSVIGVHDVASLYWSAIQLGWALPTSGLVRHLLAPGV